MEGKLSNIVSIVAVIGLIAVALSLAIVKPANNADDKLLSVSGTAELSVSPDKAEIYLNIVTEGDSAEKVQTDNKALTEKVMQSLRSMGIKDSDIETSNYYLSKNIKWDPKMQKEEDRGYILTHTLKVTTIQIDDVGNIVDAAVKAGANGVDRVSFGLLKETEKEVRSQALTRATEAAKDKASNIASAAGITVGKINSIQESNFYYTPYEANLRNDYGESADYSKSVVSPQKVDVRSSVQIAYRIV